MSGPQGANTDPLETPLTVESAARHRGSTVRARVETLRPQQWVKIGFIFALLIFS